MSLVSISKGNVKPCIHRLFRCGVFSCSVFVYDLLTYRTDNEPMFCLVAIPIGWTQGPYGLVHGTSGILTTNIENEHMYSFQDATSEHGTREHATRDQCLGAWP